jgi:hypothetical protein
MLIVWGNNESLGQGISLLKPKGFSSLKSNTREYQKPVSESDNEPHFATFPIKAASAHQQALFLQKHVLTCFYKIESSAAININQQALLPIRELPSVRISINAHHNL